MLKSNVETILAFFLAFILLDGFMIGEKFGATQNFLKLE